MASKIISHFSHEQHKLEILDSEEVGNRYGDEVYCYGCGNTAIGRPTYCCPECFVFLHESCAQLEKEINSHPMHPEHPLELTTFQSFLCNVCLKHRDGFSYRCVKCDFDVDVLCFQSDTKIKHKGHPQHPLNPLYRTASFRCDACFQEWEDLSYHCTECSFWIHKTCADLPDPFLAPALHHHPLSIDYVVQDKFLHYGKRCGYCRRRLYRSEWIYYCSPCQYFIHLNCAKKTVRSSEDEQVPPGTVILPVAEVSSLLVTNFLKKYVSQGNELTQPSNDHLTHLSHGHTLTLTNIQDDYSKMFKDDQDTVCNACVEHISGPCYTCADCNYFLHVECTQLPKEISHDRHPQHKLSLTFRPEIFSLEWCQACRRHSNGFFYECKECHVSLDMKCALLPLTVKHKAHRHLLEQAKSDFKECDACREWIPGSEIKLGCGKCNLSFHIKCIMLPETVWHRWDAHHLILCFKPFDFLGDDESICQICEKAIHPKFWSSRPLKFQASFNEIRPKIWFYHCKKCENYFHTKCLPRIAELYNVKLGDTLKIDYHQHPLTFARRAKYNSNCQDCSKDLSGCLVFDSQRCKKSFCHPCVSRKIAESGSRM